MQKFSQKVVKPSTSMKRVSALLKAEVVVLIHFQLMFQLRINQVVGF